MASVRMYIDGFNLYHAIDKIGVDALKWLNFRTLGQNLLRPGEELDQVHFFTAIWPYEASKQKRHQNFIAAQKAYGVRVHEGKFSKPQRWCEKHQRHCPFREEKQTDVGLAVKLVMDATRKEVGRMILVTADSDQIPTVHALVALKQPITLATPPGRKHEARHLSGLVTDRVDLHKERLLECQLPRTVEVKGKAVAFRPALYQV